MEAQPTTPQRATRLNAPALIATLAVGMGLFLRTYRLDSVPPLLWYDEAWFVNRARDLLETGQFHIYFPTASGGVHPLLVYLTAALAWFTGITPISSRIITALAGTATIPLIYLAGRSLLSALVGARRGRWLAALAAVIQAGLFWNVMLSRLGTEIILVQLFVIPIMHFFAIGLKRGQQRWFLWAGLLVGAALYISPNSRFVPVSLALIATGVLVFQKRYRRRALGGLALAGLAAALVFAPLAAYFVQHPGAFTGRARTVTQETLGSGKAAQAILANLINTLIGISIHGDEMVRHNLPGRPNLDPVLSIFLWIGVLVTVAWFRKDVGAIVVAGWATGMTLTTVFSDGAPIFTRSLGAAPAMILVIGMGINAVYNWLGRRFGVRPAAAATAISIAISLGLNSYDYFVRFADDPAAFDGFTAGEYQAAALARSLAERDAVYLTPADRADDSPNFELLLHDVAVRSFNTADCTIYQPQRTNHYFLDPTNDYHGLDRLAGRFPAGAVSATIEHRPDPYPLTTVFTVPPDSLPLLSHPKQAAFGQGEVRLLGADIWPTLVHPGETIYVTLAWQAVEAVDADLVALVHVAVDGDSAPVVGHDSAPCNRTYQTYFWQPGEVVFDSHTFALPADLAPGDYRLYIGLYTWPDQRRLSVEGAPQAGDRLELAPLQVSAAD